jgi:hypothetical protein
MTLFWDVTPCGWYVDTNVSEESAMFVFIPGGGSQLFLRTLVIMTQNAVRHISGDTNLGKLILTF